MTEKKGPEATQPLDEKALALQKAREVVKPTPAQEKAGPAKKTQSFNLPLLDVVGKYPAMVFDAPNGGDALCWNGIEARWEDWKGRPIDPDTVGQELPDVGYLPTTAKFFGVVSEGTFLIMDLFNPMQPAPKGAESRQASLTVLRKVMGSAPSHNHAFIEPLKVGDAAGLSNLKKKFKSLRVL